jgi:hypothetical protein
MVLTNVKGIELIFDPDIFKRFTVPFAAYAAGMRVSAEHFEKSISTNESKKPVEGGGISDSCLYLHSSVVTPLKCAE